MTGKPCRLLAVWAMLTAGGPAWACSYCAGRLQQRATFREEANTPQARLVLYGAMQRSEIDPQTGMGRTEFAVGQALRGGGLLGGRKSFVLPRYVPAAKFLLFANVLENGEIDAYRGVPVAGPAAAEYVRGVLALDQKDRAACLLFYFGHLDSPDPEVAADAFLELAKTGDAEMSKVAARFDPAKLRAWLLCPDTPEERLGLYAYLLGACGGPADADTFAAMLKKTDSERIVAAYDGLLGGYIHLRPAEGWRLAQAVLSDGKQPDLVRIAAVRALRFYMGSQPEKARPQVLACVAAVLTQGELADMAVEDLRRWRMWELTPQVLAQYGRKGVDSPLVRRAVLRYALQAPGAQAAAFVAERRRAEPAEVKIVEESLRDETPR
jgi:hypothetical protein